MSFWRMRLSSFRLSLRSPGPVRLGRPTRPRTLALLAWLALAVACTAGAAVADRFPGDLQAARSFQHYDWAWLESLMRFGHTAGSLTVLGGVLGAALLALLARRRWRAATAMALAGLAYAAEPALKAIVGRPRPVAGLVRVLVNAERSGFPSGHVLAAVLILGAVFVFADEIVWFSRPTATALRAAAVVLLAVIAASRVYLGVHWPSDVIGAALIGAALLALSVWSYRRLRTAP